MSPVYTPRQMRFIHVFMHHMQPQLKSFLHMEPDSAEQSVTLSQAIDGVSSGVNALSAAVAVAGVAGAGPSLGTSLAGAAGCIVLLQTLNGGYQFVKRRIDNQDAPFSPDETKIDETHLSLTILLRQVAYLAAVRYRHFIDEILEDNSVTTFANFVADRAFKKLASELADHDEITSDLNAETFLNYFMEKATLSLTHKSTKLTIKEEYSETTHCGTSLAITYAKLACSRAGLAVYDEDPAPGQYTLYVSPPNKLFSRNKTTLEDQYGFATVPQAEMSSDTAAVRRQDLQPLSPTSMQRALDKHKQHLSNYYQVSRQQVADYLSYIRSPDHATTPVKSFNQYLSEALKGNFIATCNDNKLAGLDLSGGDFSEVWFVNADLSDCNLEHSVWRKAHLNSTKFVRTNLSNADFQHAHAEKSTWQDLTFSGDFSHAILKGSKLSSCMISRDLNQFGCDWELVEMENSRIEDAMQLLNLRLDEQIIRENNERTRINTEIERLTKEYHACIQQSIENHRLLVSHESELGELFKKIEDMERVGAHQLTRLNSKLSDIRSQMVRIQSVQRKHGERLDRLEQEQEQDQENLSTQHPTSQSRLSFFYFGMPKRKAGISRADNKSAATTPKTHSVV